MLRHWFRTRLALHDQLHDAHAENAQLAIELDDQRDENDALRRQLDAVKAECDGHRRDLANARTELIALKATNPLTTQLQDALRHNRSLEQRLNEMTAKSHAMDVPLR